MKRPGKTGSTYQFRTDRGRCQVREGRTPHAGQLRHVGESLRDSHSDRPIPSDSSPVGRSPYQGLQTGFPVSERPGHVGESLRDSHSDRSRAFSYRETPHSIKHPPSCSSDASTTSGSIASTLGSPSRSLRLRASPAKRAVRKPRRAAGIMSLSMSFPT